MVNKYEKSAGDMRKVQSFYKDVLQNDTLLLSDIMLNNSVRRNVETISSLVSLVKEQQELLKSMQEEIERLKTPSWSNHF